jgi:D-alanyl-D-alanine carboxypeptidase
LPGAAQAAGKHAALVVDANSGRVLYAQAADEPRFPASLTKMMTLYIVFELMQQGRLEPSTRLKISGVAAGTAPSKLGLDEGAEIALIDAIKAIITKSANDVAVAVAEHIAGTEEKFARLMTQKARSLGMNATVFKNAHGLPHPEQISTARDMITLALRLNDDFPRYYGLFATRTFSYDGETYRNHNTLLGRFEGTDGIKTGYTAASGFNLVSSVRRDGKHVVGAVFGGATAGTRNATMRTLLTRALAQASTHKTRKPLLVAKAAPAPERARRSPPQLTEGAQAAAVLDRVAARTSSAQQPLRSALADGDEAGEQRMSQSPRIDIARVRPVLVAPRARTVEPTLVEPVTLASTGTSSRTTAFAEPRIAADAGPALPARGAAPSSLEAQANRISRGEPPVNTAALAAPQVHAHDDSRRSPAAHATSGVVSAFAVQIGAFGSETEAQRQLQSAFDRSGGVLDGRQPTTQPIRHAGKQLYRARFSGFDQHTAASACQELKRRQIECHVAKVE